MNEENKKVEVNVADTSRVDMTDYYVDGNPMYAYYTVDKEGKAWIDCTPYVSNLRYMEHTGNHFVSHYLGPETATYHYAHMWTYSPEEKNIPYDNTKGTYLEDLCKDLSKNLGMYKSPKGSFIYDRRNINVYFNEDAYTEWLNSDADIEMAEAGIDRDAEYDPNLIDEWTEEQSYRFEFFEDARTGERIDIKDLKNSDYIAGYTETIDKFISDWSLARQIEEEESQRLAEENERFQAENAHAESLGFYSIYDKNLCMNTLNERASDGNYYFPDIEDLAAKRIDNYKKMFSPESFTAFFKNDNEWMLRRIGISRDTYAIADTYCKLQKAVAEGKIEYGSLAYDDLWKKELAQFKKENEKYNKVDRTLELLNFPYNSDDSRNYDSKGYYELAREWYLNDMTQKWIKENNCDTLDINVLNELVVNEMNDAIEWYKNEAEISSDYEEAGTFKLMSEEIENRKKMLVGDIENKGRRIYGENQRIKSDGKRLLPNSGDFGDDNDTQYE